MAKKQSLVGVCFAGVQKLVNSETDDYCGMHEITYLTWMGMAAKIQQRNEVVNLQCVEVQRLIAEKGYRSCIIKGQSNHPSYGSLAVLRQSGDIDIWVEGGREKVVELVNSICPTKEIRETHAQLRVFPDTVVEFTPTCQEDFLYQRRLIERWHKKSVPQLIAMGRPDAAYGVSMALCKAIPQFVQDDA